MHEAAKMERKEVDTQQFIDHTLLATELMRDPNNFIMDLIDQTGVFPKTEGPTNLTTSGTNGNHTGDYNEKDFSIFQFLKNKHDEAPPRPVVSRSPVRESSYRTGKETDVEFLTLNSNFLNATGASDVNSVPVTQVQTYPAMAIEPTVPIDVDDELLYAHSISTTNARKVLPHKKRISRKLKGSLCNMDATTINGSGGYDLDQHKHVQVTSGNAVMYSCEICGYTVHTQLDFFAHLKQHYEPTIMEQRLNVPQQQKEPIDMCGLTTDDKLQQEQAKLDQVFHDVQLNFDNFHNISHVDNDDVGVNVGVGVDVGVVGVGVSVVDDVGVNMVIHADSMALHKLPSPHDGEKLDSVVNTSTPYVPPLTLKSSEVSNVPVVDEVEFSDTEDMLEGIRNVVDKVSIEDTCDELDLELTSSAMRGPWFNNNFSDIAFSGPLSQLLLPGEPPPPTRHTPSPLKPNANNTEQLTLNFLNTAKGSESVAKMEPNIKKDYLIRSNGQERPASPIATSAIEQLQRSPLMLSDSFKLEDVDTTAPASTLSLSTASDSMAAASPATSLSGPPDITNDSFLLESSSTKSATEGGTQTKGSKKLFRCEKCDRDFNSYNALKYHHHTHTQERAHQCEICGRAFYTQSALKAHEKTHSGEKPLNCEQCDARFRQCGDLKYHIISRHSEIKAHMCEYCGKSFSRKYSLVVHRRIHTSERNYSCEFCDKSFRASSYLLTHIKVHTGEKPYGCTLCDKKFRVSGDLKRHMRVHDRLMKQSSENVATEIAIPATRTEETTTPKKRRRNKLKVKLNEATTTNAIKSDAICESEQEILGL